MGVFNIHPRGLSSITCGQMERENIAYNYQALPTTIDMNEGDRIKLTYASGGIGGMVNKAQFGLVKIKFVVAFKGATQAAAMANFRTFYNAISNPEGGYVEYRPKGLATNVLTSWYEYLQSSPPKLTKTGGLIQQATENLRQHGDSASKSVVLAQFELQTKAWVTSNPQSLVTIVSATTIQNRDDATYNNHITLPNSSMKGDAFIPIVRIDGVDSVATAGRVLIYKRKSLVGASTNLDVIEAENMAQSGGWANQVLASVSGGQYERTSGSSDTLTYALDGVGFDSTYFGKVVPILFAKVTDDATAYSCTVSLADVSANTIESSTLIIDSTVWKAYYEWNELDFPPYPLPIYYDDDTSPTIGEYVTNKMSVHISFAKIEGTGSIDVDCLFLGKASEWIGCANPSLDTDVLGGYDLLFDAINGNAVIVDSSTEEFAMTAYKYGMPLSDLICMKGYNHLFKFFRFKVATGEIVQASAYDVQIDGLHATIYPFETS